MGKHQFRSIKRALIFSSVFILLLLVVYETRLVTQISCVHVPYPNPAPQTLGELYQRNQLAFFLSSLHFTKLSIASLANFDQCPPTDMSCKLNAGDLILPQCKPGDCACHAQKLAPYLKLVSHCRTVEITGEEYSASQFSGCTREAIRRYILPQNGSYSVLVFSGPGVKPIPESQANYIHRELCKLSNRNVVVIADSVRKVPICEDRTLLATGLDGKTIISLIAGAESVAAKGGENVHMGVAGMNGGRLIIPPDAIADLSWASVDEFTVVGEKGTVFRFDSADIMREAISGGQEAVRMFARGFSYLMEDDLKRVGEVFVWDVPKRRWFSHMGMS